MRTTLALDDDLAAKAQDYTGLREKSALVREALKALIDRESARRLAVWAAVRPISRQSGAAGRNRSDPR
jgi:Arc/MetJ family transcription regulator